MLADLKLKVEAYKKKLEELKKQKQDYLDASAALYPRVAAASQSKYAKLAPMQQDLAAVQGQMETVAQSEDFAQARKLSKDLASKADAFEKARAELEQQKKAYEDALAALQPQLQEALKSNYAPLKPRADDITRVKEGMEAAAQKEDYVAALASLNDLKAKVEALLADLKKLQQAEQDYTKARAALKPKSDDALVTARDFAPLKAARDAIVGADSSVETAASAQDFEKALQLVKDLEAKVDAYLKDAKTEEEKYQKKGDEITKKLDEAGYFNRDDVARAEVGKLTPDELQHLPTPVRNRLLQELQEGHASDEDKEAMKKLFSVKTLDPEFEKLDDATREKMIEKIKSDPAFKTARDNWATLTEKERVVILQKAVDYEADAYGIPKTAIETYEPDNPREYGKYSRSKGILYINPNATASKNDPFDEAIDTAVHENGHRYQYMLIDKLDAGEIKEGDPLYNQAMTFKYNGAFLLSLGKADNPTPDTGLEYLSQPMETHSRRIGTAVTQAGIGK